MMPEHWKPCWYRFLYYPTAAIFTGLMSLRIQGRRHVPPQGGVLLIANHQSYMDPPMIGVAVRRQLCYVAKKSLFGSRFLAWFIDSLGALPINNEASGTDGIKASLTLLKAGKAVLVFPEGGRTPDGRVHPLKPGVVVLIRRARVPILPVGIAGAYESWPMHQFFPRLDPLFWPTNGGSVAAVIGKPIAAEELCSLPPEQTLERLHQTLDDLRGKAEKLRRRPAQMAKEPIPRPQNGQAAPASIPLPGNPAA